MIKIEHLTIGYGRKKVVENISLCLQSAHIYGIFGVNGVGKTTFLRTLAGATRPISGSIDAFTYVPFEREKGFLSNMILVENGIMLPAVTAEKFVETFSEFYPRFSKELYAEYSRELGIGPNDRLANLSTGKKQCFNISFSLACRAHLTLLDEPMNGLDIISRQNLLKILARGDNDDGILLISSHDTSGLGNIVTDIIVLREKQSPLHAPLDTIGKMLSFNNEGSYPDTLYENGLNSISINTAGIENDVDIDILFRALISDKYFVEKFNNLISSTSCDN